MQARDVMTAPVVTVTPLSLVGHIVELVLERRISGVPVVEGTRLVGIVSESDLLHRHEIGTDALPPARSWWRRLTLRDELPALYVKSHGRRARDIMTRRVVHVTEDSDPADNTRLVALREYYVLQPGETVHGATLEKISLPPNLCGWLEGRSRTARFGLTVHVTSGFVHPGVSNVQVLEMMNVSRTPLALHPGIRICQIVLERTEGEAVYRGRFAKQLAP